MLDRPENRNPLHDAPPLNAAGVPVEARKRRGRFPLWLGAALLLLVAGWSAAWYVLAGRIDAEADRWLAREAEQDRRHDCADRRVGGFPFRLEIGCRSVTSTVPANRGELVVRTGAVRAVAQVYSPGHVIAEFDSPVAITSPDLGAVTATFALAQASYRGTLDAMTQLSLVVDGLGVRLGEAAEPASTAAHVELHARPTPGRPANARDFDVALAAEALRVGPSAPAKLALQTTAFAVPDRWRGAADTLRDWQARGGRLGLSAGRAEIGKVLAQGTGSATLGADGRPNGRVELDVVGLDQLSALLPGLGLGNAGTLVGTGLAFLGAPAKIDGRNATRLNLTFDDGRARLGPIALGRVPPLY